MSNHIEETCSCGATFQAHGLMAAIHATQWRNEHQHTRPPAPAATEPPPPPPNRRTKEK